MFLLTGMLLTGCTGDDNGGFSNGGNYNVNDFIDEVDTGSSSDTEDTEETPEGTPVIDTITVDMEQDYGGFDFALVISVDYTDSDDNVDGGYFRCLFEVDGGNEEYCATEDADGNSLTNGEIPIDGYNAYDSGGTVELGFDASSYGDATSIYITGTLIDTDGNESESAQAGISK